MTERLRDRLSGRLVSGDVLVLLSSMSSASRPPQSVVFGRMLRRMWPNMVRGLSGAPSSGGPLVIVIPVVCL